MSRPKDKMLGKAWDAGNKIGINDERMKWQLGASVLFIVVAIVSLISTSIYDFQKVKEVEVEEVFVFQNPDGTTTECIDVSEWGYRFECDDGFIRKEKTEPYKIYERELNPTTGEC